MESGGFTEPVGAVERWLSVGRDVVVRGDRGAGKSTVLETLLADLSQRGAQALLLRARGATPLSTLLNHPSAPLGTPDEAELTEWLVAELEGPRRSVLLLDDADRVDTSSLSVVARALARTSCVLITTTTRDPLRDPTAGMGGLLLERAPAEVRVPPLDFRGVADLLGSVLGAPAGAGLTAAVVARTGGNPRAVLALTDAALAGGALQRVDDVWTDRGTLDRVPVDAVAYVFLAGMRTELVHALETLATTGPVSAEVVDHVVDPDLLDELMESGRVVRHESGQPGRLVGVAPPVLARALRERARPHRRRQVTERLGTVLGRSGDTGGPDLGPGVAQRFTCSEVQDADGRWAAELSGLIYEHVLAEELATRATWLQAPSVRTANAYLALLMRRPATEALQAVFTTTQATDRDDHDERLTFAYHHARWLNWRGAAKADVVGAFAASGIDPAGLRELQGLKTHVVREIQRGRPVAEIATATAPDGLFRMLHGVPVLFHAAGLLEAGHPAHAVRVCEQHEDLDAEPEVRHYLAGVRGIALAMAGRPAEAEAWARRLLRTACESLDSLGIRVHAGVLAEALYLSGQSEAAWQVLGTSLRLGAPGPAETTFHRRGLTVGAVLQAHAGNTDLAQVLLRELDTTPGNYYAPLRSMRALAHVAVADATGAGAAAGEKAWEVGLSLADRGLLQPALLIWATGPATLDAGRVPAVRAALARADVPGVEPYVRLLLATAEQDKEAVTALLPAVHRLVAPMLVRAAEKLVGARRPNQAATERVVRRGPDWGSLTTREREITTMAGRGMSNRTIAARLHLSVRTVENHMSRALGKLGVTTRQELMTSRQPEERAP